MMTIQQPADVPESTVPPITITEPVFETPNATDSTWVSCEAHYDPESDVFLNFGAEESWILDEHTHNDSTYEVNGTEYSDMYAAIAAALEGTPHWPSDIPADLPPEYVGVEYTSELPSVKLVHSTESDEDNTQ